MAIFTATIGTIPIWFIIVIVLAFAWLMYETRFLTIRLESYGYQKQQLELAQKQAEAQVKVKDIPEDTKPLKPVEFTPLDMPEFTGTLNIVCERG